jgi:uncharacterized protein
MSWVMNLDLREFESFPAELSVEVETDSAEYGIDGIAFHEPTNVKLSIQKVKEEYYCHGEATVKVEAECSRCLELFDLELNGELNFVIKTEQGESILSSDANQEVIYVKSSEPVVELNEPIRQALLLSLPMKPVCNPECRGLCPSCGVNLNLESCDCTGREVDERWEGLRDLLE